MRSGPGLFGILAGIFMIGMGVMFMLYFGIAGLFVATAALFGTSSALPSASAAGHVGTILGGLGMFGFGAVCIWRGIESFTAKGDAPPAEARPGYRIGNAWGRALGRYLRR